MWFSRRWIDLYKAAAISNNYKAIIQCTEKGAKLFFTSNLGLVTLVQIIENQDGHTIIDVFLSLELNIPFPSKTSSYVLFDVETPRTLPAPTATAVAKGVAKDILFFNTWWLGDRGVAVTANWASAPVWKKLHKLNKERDCNFFQFKVL